MRHKLVLLLASTLFTALTLEGTVRFFYTKIGNYQTEMFRYAAEHKVITSNPELPFRHVPNKVGTYYGVEIKTNSIGFRDKEYDTQKPPETQRILVAGDSVTLGWGVESNQTFAELLEAMFAAANQKVEVINMGTGNYNTTMEVALIQAVGLEFDPDIILLIYFINDAEPTPRPSKLGTFLKKHSYLLALLHGKYLGLVPQFNAQLYWENYYRNLYAKDSASLKTNSQALQTLMELTKKKNISLLIVNFPELHKPNDYPFEFVTDYVRSQAEDHDIPFLDLLPSLKTQQPQDLWVSPEDPHPNAFAHEIAAQEIYMAINDNGLLGKNVIDSGFSKSPLHTVLREDEISLLRSLIEVP